MNPKNHDSESDWLPSVFSTWFQWQYSDGACDVCRGNVGLYEPGSEPSLPPEGCTCIGGCKCRYVEAPYPPVEENASEASELPVSRRREVPQERLLEYLITALAMKAGGEIRIPARDIVWNGELRAVFDTENQEYVLIAEAEPPMAANVN